MTDIVKRPHKKKRFKWHEERKKFWQGVIKDNMQKVTDALNKLRNERPK